MDDQPIEGVDQGEALPESQDIETQDAQDADGAVDESQQTDQPSDEDSEEVDYEGQKYRVPKPLKEALLRQADYTRKTQEVSEQRRALEQDQQSFQQVQQLRQQHMQGYAQLMAIEGQLKQFEGLNLMQLNDTDPVSAQRLLIQRQQLIEARQNVAASLQQAEAQALEKQQTAFAKRLEESRAVVAREIPNWSPEKGKALAAFAVSRGAPADVIANVTEPWLVKLIHDAHEYHQLQAKAAKPPPKPAVVAKPVSQLPSGKNPVNKDPSQMTDSEFNAWRRRQIAQRR